MKVTRKRKIFARLHRLEIRLYNKGYINFWTGRKICQFLSFLEHKVF